MHARRPRRELKTRPRRSGIDPELRKKRKRRRRRARDPADMWEVLPMSRGRLLIGHGEAP